MPQQRPVGFRQWYKRQTSIAKIGIGCGTLIGVLLLCSFVQAALGGGNSSSTPTHPSGQVAVVSPVATEKIVATPTHTYKQKPTISLSSAILGGSINAFDKKFGSDNCCYENGWTPPNGPLVSVWDASYGRLGDENSLQRVVRISIQPQSNGQTDTPVWSASTAATICDAYLPPDANFQFGYTVPLANLTQGYTKVYYSALLANTLPNQDFIGKDGNQGKLGLLYVYFSYNYDADHIGHCTLGVRSKDDLEY
jgi:hypothetical protein